MTAANPKQPFGIFIFFAPRKAIIQTYKLPIVVVKYKHFLRVFEVCEKGYLDNSLLILLDISKNLDE